MEQKRTDIELRRENLVELRKRLKKRRRSKRNDVYETFDCDCGKRYLTYSALYLHVQKKHQIKMSKKQTDKFFMKEIRGSLTKFLFLSMENGEQKNNSDNVKHQIPISNQICMSPAHSDTFYPTTFWQNVLQTFFKCQNLKHSQKNILQFLQFVNRKESARGLDYRSILKMAPNYLNHYVLQFRSNRLESLTATKKEEQEKICQDLFHFYYWLRYNNYTDLIVVKQIC